MKRNPRPLRPLHHLGALMTSAALAACATSPPVASGREPLLIVTTPLVELHVKDGEVYEVVPARGDQREVIKKIGSFDDFRTLYEAATGEALPPRDKGSVQVTGWLGLECVRAGRSCGAAPAEGAPRGLVSLRFEF